jgi:hypothetical protein
MQNIFSKVLLWAALCAVIAIGTTSFAQVHKDSGDVSTSELLRVLRIKTFRVRTPKDPWVWDLKIIKQSEVKPLRSPIDLAAAAWAFLLYETSETTSTNSHCLNMAGPLARASLNFANSLIVRDSIRHIG